MWSSRSGWMEDVESEVLLPLCVVKGASVLSPQSIGDSAVETGASSSRREPASGKGSGSRCLLFGGCAISAFAIEVAVEPFPSTCLVPGLGRNLNPASAYLSGYRFRNRSRRSVALLLRRSRLESSWMRVQCGPYIMYPCSRCASSSSVNARRSRRLAFKNGP